MHNRDRMILRALCVLFAVLLSAGCATTGGSDDPLKYTKKLVAEGHSTLYNNGAFEVPHTDIKLIPPAPDTLTLVSELAGLRAAQSFELSVKKAADSVTIVADGTRRTYQFSKEIGALGREAARAIDQSVTENGKVIVYRSTDLGRSIIGRSWDVSAELMRGGAGQSVIQGSRRGGEQVIQGGMGSGEKLVEGSKEAGDRLSDGSVASGKQIISEGVAAGDRIIDGSSAAGDRLFKGAGGDKVTEGGVAAGERLVESDAGDRIIKESRAAQRNISAGSAAAGERLITGGDALGDTMVSGSLDAAKDLSASSLERSEKALRYAGTSFVRGYAAVPANLKRRAERTGENLQRLSIVGMLGQENEWRKEWSEKTINLLGGTIGDYGTTATSSFRRIGEEMSENYKTQGVSLSVLKSLRWALQGLLWDATVEPLAKTTGAALGYLSVNLVAFPTVVLVKEGVVTTRLAVQVTMDTARTGYDIVAPTTIAAIAGVYGVADLAAVQPVAGATAVAGPVAGYAEKGLSLAAGEAVKGGGYAAGKVVQGGGLVAGAAVGGGSVVAGEALKGGSYVAGTAVTGGEIVAGGLAAGGGFLAGEAVKGGSYVAGVTVMSSGYVAGQAVKGGGFVAGTAVKGSGIVAGTTVKGGGYAAGKAVQYIAIPLASAGITVGGGAIGTAVGVTGAVAGGTVVVTGETGEAASTVFGNVIAGTTLAAGTGVSAAGGAAYGVYQLSKAVVVPVGYEFGSGMVLSYEALSQIGAHALLAVSDCAYMVLSLEGPRWVLYAVKGNLGRGEELPAGTMLDLKKMQEQGEEIVNLPVSDEEMKKVVESVYDGLPELPAANVDQK